MMLDVIIYGVYGSLMFFMASFYTIKILSNLEDHPEISLTNFFTRKETPKVFKILSISASVLTIGYTFNMIGSLFGFYVSNYIVVFVNFMIFVVLLYFFKEVYHITSRVTE